MHVNRGLLFWGLALITAGVVALGAMQGLIDTALLADAWRLWPLVLIAIGLSVVLARTPFAVVGTVIAALVVGAAGGAVIAVGPGIVSCGDTSASSRTADGDFTLPEATIHLQLSCGGLTLDMADGSGWRAVTASVEDDPIQLEAAAGSLDIRSNNGGGFPFSRDRHEWAVSLGRDVTYDISGSLNAADSAFDLAGGTFSRIALEPNAGSLRMDLAGAEVQDMRVLLNAGSLTVVADAATGLSGLIGANAGSVDFCAPQGSALRFTINDNVAFSHNLDESGLEQSGTTFASPGFDTAEHHIDLRLQGNAASFELNPEGGCA